MDAVQVVDKRFAFLSSLSMFMTHTNANVLEM